MGCCPSEHPDKKSKNTGKQSSRRLEPLGKFVRNCASSGFSKVHEGASQWIARRFPIQALEKLGDRRVPLQKKRPPPRGQLWAVALRDLIPLICPSRQP